MALEHLEALREMKRNRPFIPFRILTTGTETFLVEDRFQFAVGQSEMSYARPASGGLVHLSADRIVAVEAMVRKPAV